MKKAKILLIITMMCLVFTSVYAIDLPSVDDDLTYGQEASQEVKTVAGGAWATVIIVAQILSVAAVVFAGVRYMFASADQKADIKKSMSVLALGSVLVFGATMVLKFIMDSATEILN